MEFVVAASAEAAATEAAILLGEAAAAGASIVLTGGSTPRRAYELAAERQPDWSGAEVWWGDERCVPPSDERSNYGLANESLLVRLEAPPRAVHRIRGEAGAQAAATAYDAELDGARLDLVLLGLGSDGHAASLFPNASTLGESERRAIPAEPQLDPFVDRVTLTIPALCSGGQVVWLVTGSGKAEAARRAFASPPDPATPASLIRSRTGTNLAILDLEAAVNLAI